MPGMKKTTDNTKRKLAELGALSSRTDGAERRILESAESKLQKMQARIAELRHAAMLGGAEAEEYQRLVADRHRLQVVVAQARKNLGE